MFRLGSLLQAKVKCFSNSLFLNFIFNIKFFYYQKFYGLLIRFGFFIGL